MCIIIDANRAASIFPSADRKRDPASQPIIDWLYRSKGATGALVYGGKLADELANVETAWRAVLALKRAGRAFEFPADAVKNEERTVAPACKSDDPHVIALARVSGARVLYSEDTTLHEDWKNLALVAKPRGVIYRSTAHRHLLRHSDSCPKGSP